LTLGTGGAFYLLYFVPLAVIIEIMKELCGSHLIFSGMNSACPNCKGRRAVKNLSEHESARNKLSLMKKSVNLWQFKHNVISLPLE